MLQQLSVVPGAGPLIVAPFSPSGAGAPDEAIALVQESLTLFRPLHDKYAIVYVLVPLAAAAVLKGDDLWPHGFWVLKPLLPNVQVSQSPTNRP